MTAEYPQRIEAIPNRDITRIWEIDSSQFNSLINCIYTHQNLSTNSVTIDLEVYGLSLSGAYFTGDSQNNRTEKCGAVLNHRLLKQADRGQFYVVELSLPPQWDPQTAHPKYELDEILRSCQTTRIR